MNFILAICFNRFNRNNSKFDLCCLDQTLLKYFDFFVLNICITILFAFLYRIRFHPHTLLYIQFLPHEYKHCRVYLVFLPWKSLYRLKSFLLGSRLLNDFSFEFANGICTDYHIIVVGFFIQFLFYVDEFLLTSLSHIFDNAGKFAFIKIFLETWCHNLEVDVLVLE